MSNDLHPFKVGDKVVLNYQARVDIEDFSPILNGDPLAVREIAEVTNSGLIKVSNSDGETWWPGWWKLAYIESTTILNEYTID